MTPTRRKLLAVFAEKNMIWKQAFSEAGLQRVHGYAAQRWLIANGLVEPTSPRTSVNPPGDFARITQAGRAALEAEDASGMTGDKT